MILDTLNRHAAYQFLDPNLVRGLKWLADFSPETPDGRYDISGQDVFALVQSYDTVESAERKYESHRQYIDIQYVVAGTEVIYYAPADRLPPVIDYDTVKDYQLFADPSASTPLHLTAGSFAIFYPHDGHKPGCVNGAIRQVKKVVIKARV